MGYIREKKLAADTPNFTVTSYPSAGAILMFVAGALGPVILFWEWFRRRKTMPAE